MCIRDRGIIDDPKYQDLFSVEEVNRLVNQGMPFRDAYVEVGRSLETGEITLDKQVDHTHLGSIGNLANDQIEAKLSSLMKAFGFDKANAAIQRLVNN